MTELNEKDYKAGDLLYVRTTEEPTTVIATRRLNPGDKRFPAEYKGNGIIVVVRRPIIRDGGVENYVFYDFLSEELATDYEMTALRIARLKAGQELYRDELPDGPGGPALVKN